MVEKEGREAPGLALPGLACLQAEALRRTWSREERGWRCNKALGLDGKREWASSRKGRKGSGKSEFPTVLTPKRLGPPSGRSPVLACREEEEGVWTRWRNRDQGVEGQGHGLGEVRASP